MAISREDAEAVDVIHDGAAYDSTTWGLMSNAREHIKSDTPAPRHQSFLATISTIRRTTSPSLRYFRARACQRPCALLRDGPAPLALRRSLSPALPSPLASFSSLRTLRLPTRTKAPMVERITPQLGIYHTKTCRLRWRTRSVRVLNRLGLGIYQSVIEKTWPCVPHVGDRRAAMAHPPIINNSRGEGGED